MHTQKRFVLPRLLTLFIATGIVGSLICAYVLVFMPSAKAAPVDESCFSTTLAGGEITITGYDAVTCGTDVDIPGTIGGDPVTTIGAASFFMKNLTSLTIPNSVTTISQMAFAANSLTSLAIPNSVTTIGAYAFMQNSLTSLTIPNSVTTIDQMAFMQNSLTSLTLGTSVVSIGGWAFVYNQLQTVTIPASVTTIGKMAFGVQGVDLSDPDPDAVFISRLILEDPANPHNLQDDVFVEADEAEDFNGDGDLDDAFILHLINAAPLNLSFQSSDGTVLSTVYQTGPTLTDYLMFSNPTGDTSRYYRIGDTVTYTLPAIDGYVTPAPQTFVLGASTNTTPQVLTYLTQAEIDAGITIDPDTGLPVVPAAPATGLAKLGGGPLLVILGGALIAGAASVAMVGARQRVRR